MAERIEQIRKRLALSLRGPWRFVNNADAIPAKNRIETCNGDFICKGASDISCEDIPAQTADFIVNAPADIEYLLTLLTNLSYENESMRKDLDNQTLRIHISNKEVG